MKENICVCMYVCVSVCLSVCVRVRVCVYFVKLSISNWHLRFPLYTINDDIFAEFNRNDTYLRNIQPEK